MTLYHRAHHNLPMPWSCACTLAMRHVSASYDPSVRSRTDTEDCAEGGELDSELMAAVVATLYTATNLPEDTSVLGTGRAHN